MRSTAPADSGPAAPAPLTVCAALGVEARAARQAVGARPGVRVVRIGMRGSRLTTAGVLPQRGARVLLAGFAGGLHPTLRPGDVVVATEIRTTRGAVISCRPSAELLEALRTTGIEPITGPLASSDHIVRGAERAELAASGAVAVDMESGPLATALDLDRARARDLDREPDAEEHELDVVRVIVDTAQRGLLRAAVLDGVAAYRVLRRVIENLTDGMFRPDPGRSDTVETSTRAAAVVQSTGAGPENARVANDRPSRVCSVQEGG